MKKKDELILLLNSKEESERLYAVEDILDFGLIELSLELLTRLKVETSPAVKNSIVSVLQKMEHTPAYPVIFKLFPDRDAFMRNGISYVEFDARRCSIWNGRKVARTI